MAEKCYLFVSHQARIRCLMDSLYKQYAPPHLREDLNIYKGNTGKFKNAAVLKLTLYDVGWDPKESNPLFRHLYFKGMEMEMVYEGELSEEGGPEYFTMQNFRKYTDCCEIGTPSIFYIVRHGEGFHNKMGTAEKAGKVIYAKAGGETNLINANLTTVGVLQAYKAGRFLSNQSLTFTHIFVSDLARTMETAIGFMTGLGYKGDSGQLNLVVIPCSHEVDKTQSKCDNSPWSLPENTPHNSKSIPIRNSGEAIQHIKEGFGLRGITTAPEIREQYGDIAVDIERTLSAVDIKYEQYLTKYGGKVREYTSEHHALCKDRTMITEALGYIKIGEDLDARFAALNPSEDEDLDARFAALKGGSKRKSSTYGRKRSTKKRRKKKKKTRKKKKKKKTRRR
jgi:phosphohistidine phosphatase SixA